jgi:hypothetical protein
MHGLVRGLYTDSISAEIKETIAQNKALKRENAELRLGQ